MPRPVTARDHPWSSRLAFGAIVLGTLAVGCTAELPRPSAVADLRDRSWVEARYPPPPARPEVIPKPPDEEALWIDGEWRWRGVRWAWLRGRWVHLPSPDARFSAWTMDRRSDGALMYSAGTWVDAGGRQLGTRPALELVHPAQRAEGVEDKRTVEGVGRTPQECQPTASPTSARRGCHPDCPVGDREPVAAP